MCLHQMLNDRQSKPGAFGLPRSRLVRPVEPLENPRQVRRGDSNAGVFDADRHLTIFFAGRDGDRPARPVELDGVVNQIEEYLFKQAAVGGNNQVFGNRDRKREIRFGGPPIEQAVTSVATSRNPTGFRSIGTRPASIAARSEMSDTSSLIRAAWRRSLSRKRTRSRGSSAAPDRLMAGLIPANRYYELHINLIKHGRNVCRPRRPSCENLLPDRLLRVLQSALNGGGVNYLSYSTITRSVALLPKVSG